MTQTQHATRAAAVMRDLVTIQTHVANAFGYTVDGLLAVGRREPLVTHRQIAMWLCREITGASYPDIAIAFRKGNHMTALFAHQVVPNKLLTHAEMRIKLPKIKKAIAAALENRP